jgi:hypothetical protein
MMMGRTDVRQDEHENDCRKHISKTNQPDIREMDGIKKFQQVNEETQKIKEENTTPAVTSSLNDLRPTSLPPSPTATPSSKTGIIIPPFLT